MRINTNIAALNSYNQLKNTQNNLSKSLQRLSSGKRINGAADDAAGLAISEKMKAQTSGLAMAQRNAQDGISMIQTAEGALKESHSILQRMRELAVQSANDTNTSEDRAEIQKEVEQLKSELNRISETTEFNTKKLLDGSIAKTANSTGNFASTSITGVNVNNDNLKEDTYTATVSSAVENFTELTDTTDVSAIAINGANTVDMGEYSLEATENSGDNSQLDYVLKDENGKQIATATVAKSATTATVGNFDFTVSDTSGGTTGEGTLNFTVGQDITMSVTDSTGTSMGSTTVTNETSGTVSVGGFDFSYNSDLTAASDADVEVNDNSVAFQIGANESQNTNLSINNMNTTSLSIESLDVSNQTGAENAISSLDDAIAQVSGERSKLGAVQNRLDHTINNLNTAQENLTAAESRISDVDMAKEMMSFTKSQILSQAGTAMMAQANQIPQGVLQLLG